MNICIRPYIDLIHCRLPSQSFSSLDCKMRWFPHSTCKCCMLKQLLETGDASLWSFLLACTWTHGWLVVTTIGKLFSFSLNKMSQSRQKFNHPTTTMVTILPSPTIPNIPLILNNHSPQKPDSFVLATSVIAPP